MEIKIKNIIIPMSTTGLKRKTIDKFYTAHPIVNKCIELINNTLDISV